MIRKVFASTLMTGLAASSFSIGATEVSANGGDGSFGINLATPVTSNLRADLGYLNTDGHHGNADIYTAGLMFAPPTPHLHWALGARYQYQDARWGHGGGVGLGGSLFVDTPIRRLSVGGYGFYTPSSLSSGDLHKSYEYGGQLRFRINGGLSLYGGYRWMRSDFSGHGEHDLFKGPIFGVNVGL